MRDQKLEAFVGQLTPVVTGAPLDLHWLHAPPRGALSKAFVALCVSCWRGQMLGRGWGRHLAGAQSLQGSWSL